MNGMEEFNEARAWAKVGAGFKGGPFNKSWNLAPSLTFVDGYPSEVTEKLNGGPIPQEKPLDPWVARYPNSKMK